MLRDEFIAAVREMANIRKYIHGRINLGNPFVSIVEFHAVRQAALAKISVILFINGAYYI